MMIGAYTDSVTVPWLQRRWDMKDIKGQIVVVELNEALKW